MNCPHCQTALPADAKFCGACGKTLSTAPAPAPQKRTASFSGTFAPSDFSRALDILCEEQDRALPPGPPPDDHESLNAAATALGFSKVDIKQALHRVSIEKLTPEERAAYGIVLDEDDAPDRPRRRAMAAVLSSAAVLVLAAGGGLIWWLQDEPPPPTPEAIEGAIDEQALSTAVDKAATVAQTCVTDALKGAALPKTEIQVALRIDTNGHAASVAVKPEAADPRLVQCVRTAVDAATFPAAEGAPVDVEVPLTFQSAEK